MREGYDGNTVQAACEQVASTLFEENIELVIKAREDGGESAAAMRATEELIERNRGLVKKIALRFVGRGVELDDLLQIGTIGMLKAIRSFDVERGTQFSTYAVPLVFGEIRKHLRDEGPIKVGRYYKRLGAQLLALRSEIFANEGREARIGELAERCGVSTEEAAMALDATSPMTSLFDYAYSEEDGVFVGDTLADEDSLLENERIIDRIALSEAISSLPRDWQKIIVCRYYRGMTQEATARLLGVTQVKVSREEKKILEALRQKLA